MKKFFLIALLFTSSTIALTAQTQVISNKRAESLSKPHLTPAQRVEKRVDQLDAILGLTPEQKNKVIVIQTKLAADLTATRKEYGKTDVEKFMAERKNLFQASSQEIKAFLTKEQLTKWRNYRTDQKNIRQNAKNAATGAKTPANVIPKTTQEDEFDFIGF